MICLSVCGLDDAGKTRPPVPRKKNKDQESNKNTDISRPPPNETEQLRMSVIKSMRIACMDGRMNVSIDKRQVTVCRTV